MPGDDLTLVESHLHRPCPRVDRRSLHSHIDPEADLLSRRVVAEEVPDTIVAEVRRVAFAGHKLRIHYAATGQTPQWRTVDPIGLVTVRDRGYLLTCWTPRGLSSPKKPTQTAGYG